MKKNELKKFEHRIIRNTIFSMFFAIVIVFLLFKLLLDGLFNDILANILSSINYSLYYFFVYYKETILLGSFLFIVLGIVCYFLSRFMKQFSKIIFSIELITQETNDLISLPPDYKEVETILNQIKYDYLRNEQIAKEAETKKNDLLMYLAHDLKTPLTSMIGYLTLLKDEENLPTDIQKKYIGISLSKSKRLEELINEFFEITRFNLQTITLEKETINLSYLLEQLSDEFYPSLSSKNLKCDLQLEPNIFLYADGNQLARVFDNLLRNAIAYSFPDSTITICLSSSENEIKIYFKNIGIKIPEHKLANIFEKFYRVDSSRNTSTGGTGLGLAIAKQIIELHEGSIQASSSEESTVFTIVLPKQKDS